MFKTRVIFRLSSLAIQHSNYHLAQTKPLERSWQVPLKFYRNPSLILSIYSSLLFTFTSPSNLRFSSLTDHIFLLE